MFIPRNSLIRLSMAEERTRCEIKARPRFCSRLLDATKSHWSSKLSLFNSIRTPGQHYTLSILPTSIPRLLESPTPESFRANTAQFLGQTCIGYLMNPVFAQESSHRKREYWRQVYPFLHHCIIRWPAYLRREPGDPDDYLNVETREALKVFFATSYVDLSQICFVFSITRKQR